MQVREMGEVTVEVGAPDGWGPVGLDASQLQTVLDKCKEAAATVSADVTVLRRRQVHVPTLGDAGL